MSDTIIIASYIIMAIIMFFSLIYLWVGIEKECLSVGGLIIITVLAVIWPFIVVYGLLYIVSCGIAEILWWALTHLSTVLAYKIYCKREK